MEKRNVSAFIPSWVYEILMKEAIKEMRTRSGQIAYILMEWALNKRQKEE